MKKRINGLLALLLVLITQFNFAQDMNISGVVSDSNGLPISGANVRVKGTTVGTQTDFDGSYKIKAASTATIVFSFQGMNSQELKVSGAKMNARLSTKATELEGIIVGAVGIKKKKEAVTSSYATVSNKELKSAANPDVVRSLIGKVSGITINGTTNGVNGSNSIRIRSMLSVGGNTEALVVIDNVISTADVLVSLPSEAIENVTVLKGAQGAALYGSQGKQGVVLVTTKKGGKGDKITVALTSTTDFENINFVPKRQEKYGQGWYNTRDPQENGGWGPLLDGTVGPVGIPNPDGTYDINAPYTSLGDSEIKKFYKTGIILNNNINLNMGTAESFLNLNLGNLKRDFILEGDELNRNTLVLSAGKKINKLTLGGTITFTNQRTKQANVNAATSRGDYTLLTNLLQTGSNVPISLFKDRGVYGWNGYYQNPYWAKDNNRLNETNNFYNLGLNIEYEFTKNFSIKYNGSVQNRGINQQSYANATIGPVKADGGIDSPSEFFQSNFNSIYYYGDIIASFNYKLNEDLGLRFNIGHNMQHNQTSRVSQGGTNLQIEKLYNINNVLNPAIPSSLNNRAFVNRFVAPFANIDLNYKDYLFLNATARYEGNSVARKENRFSFYPSVGLSFIPTKALEFLKDKTILSNMKLYGNYTKVGSLDPIGAYETTETARISANFPFPNTGLSYNNPNDPTDPNIKPETYTTLEAGINLGFFNERLTIDVAGFKTTTKDLITDTSTSTASGDLSKKFNSGELDAKGLEIDLGFMPFNGENFKWNGRFSYSTYETIVKDAGASDKIVLYDGGNSQINGNISAVETLPFPYITGTDWARDDQGRVIVDSSGRPAAASQFKNLGKVTPDYILGLTNNFEYKGVGLSFVMDYRTGHSFLSQTKYNLTWNGHLDESAEFDRNVGFIYPNSVIDNPATPGVVDYIPNELTLTGGFASLTGTSNRTQAYYGAASNLGANNLIDATAFKLREIAISYSIPAKVLKNSGLQSFKIGINARNAFVKLAASNKGYADPEASNQNNSSTSNAARNAAGTLTNTSRNGIGYIGDAQYPSTRTFGFSINATF